VSVILPLTAGVVIMLASHLSERRQVRARQRGGVRQPRFDTPAAGPDAAPATSFEDKTIPNTVPPVAAAAVADPVDLSHPPPDAEPEPPPLPRGGSSALAAQDPRLRDLAIRPGTRPEFNDTGRWRFKRSADHHGTLFLCCATGVLMALLLVPGPGPLIPPPETAKACCADTREEASHPLGRNHEDVKPTRGTGNMGERKTANPGLPIAATPPAPLPPADTGADADLHPSDPRARSDDYRPASDRPDTERDNGPQRAWLGHPSNSEPEPEPAAEPRTRGPETVLTKLTVSTTGPGAIEPAADPRDAPTTPRTDQPIAVSAKPSEPAADPRDAPTTPRTDQPIAVSATRSEPMAAHDPKPNAAETALTNIAVHPAIERRSEDRRAQNLAESPRPVAEQGAQPVSTPGTEKSGRPGGYRVQVGSFLFPWHAAAADQALRRAGYTPYRVRWIDPDRVTWFVVRLRGYPSLPDALAVARAVERQTGYAAIVLN